MRTCILATMAFVIVPGLAEAQKLRSAPNQYSDPGQSGNQNSGNFGRIDFFNPSGGNFNPGFQNNFNQQHNHHHNQNFTPYVPNNSSHTPYQGNYPSGSGVYSRNYSGATVYRSPPPAPKVYSQLPITIRCPHGMTGICSYELVSASGRSYTYIISEGQTQRLKESTDWLIRYRAGSETQVYQLRGGRNYELHNVDGGWQLYTAR